MALIFGSGGAESEFTSSIPQIKKEIKKYEKKKKKQFKTLNKISPDREKTSGEFMAAYDAYYQSRKELMSQLIGYRIMFQDKISEDELLLVIEEAYMDSKKERRQDQKAEEKSEDKLNKIFEDLNEIVLRHIEDSSKVEIVTQSLHEFESSLYAAVDETYNLEVERKLRQKVIENTDEKEWKDINKELKVFLKN